MKYTVKKGDNLSKIAAATNAGSWKELWVKNRDVVGHDPDLIHPGTVIDVPFNLKAWFNNILNIKVLK